VLRSTQATWDKAPLVLNHIAPQRKDKVGSVPEKSPCGK
jgi:hypothetical protein